MGKAHFTAKYEETDPWQEIDPISKECVSCHDGVFASSVTIRAGVWTHQKELMTFDKGSHPIGIDYEAARVSNRRAWLRPMSLVDPRIRFFDGKVGCGSCHNPYSNIEARLVMSDRESMLCMSCHQLDRG
jgi:predicted CXXCH cytochrome family protein